MAEIKIRKKSYFHKLISALRNLLSAQEILSPRNIRKDHLQYFFSFPIAMTFINIQDFVVDDGIGIFGLAHTTITFLAFVIGAVLIFSFSSVKNTTTISKFSQ